MSWANTSFDLVCKGEDLVARIASSWGNFELKLLFNGQSDIVDIEVALAVVDVDYCFTNLRGFEDVFLKSHTDRGRSLVHAAPSGDPVGLVLIDVGLISFSLLSYNQNLLVLHHGFLVMIFKDGLDVILHLSFHFLLAMLLIQDARGELSRKLELEGNGIVTWHESWD